MPTSDLPTVGNSEVGISEGNPVLHSVIERIDRENKATPALSAPGMWGNWLDRRDPLSQ